jgi:hypothetical protein
LSILQSALEIRTSRATSVAEAVVMWLAAKTYTTGRDKPVAFGVLTLLAVKED